MKHESKKGKVKENPGGDEQDEDAQDKFSKAD
jgi:hypothetical protein